MNQPKTSKSKEGKVMHYSVGAVIEENGKYLLIDRKIYPPGFAGIAGHLDEGETPEQAIVREIKEEAGLDAENCKLLLEEEMSWNKCSRGIGCHYWYLFKCQVKGEINQNKRETKSIGGYTKEEIKKLNLEPVWKYCFEKLKII
jgi:8-oxo-dGTP pyrophosphatase MutT (NUDIX family)